MKAVVQNSGEPTKVRTQGWEAEPEEGPDLYMGPEVKGNIVN